MNNMKTYKFILGLAFIAVLTNFGCSEDFLDKKNPNDVTTEAFWKTENHLYLGITSVYATISFDYMYGQFEYNWVPNACRADDYTNTSPWYGWKNMENFTLNNTYYEIEEWWNMNYRAIAQSNQVLENVDKVAGLVELTRSADEWKAEARFLRAYSYVNLLNSFRYPVFSDAFAKTEEDYFKTQPERDVIWQLVEEDLNFAMNYLPVSRDEDPDNFDNVGRAVAAAAAAYLGKAYLTQGKYSDAVTVLSKIRNGDFGTYSLIEDFGENFDGTMENNEESLFEIMYANNPINKRRTVHSIGGALNDREIYPSNWIFNEMKSELDLDGNYDERLMATIFCNLPGSYSITGEDFYADRYAGQIAAANADPVNNPVLFTDKDGNEVRFNVLHYNKYQQSPNDMVDGWRNINNIVVMRYADVLLMLAEAENEVQAAPGTLAYACVNEVRDRANLAPLGGLTKQQFREKIMHERAVEFAGENTRFADLVRWDEHGFITLKEYLGLHGKDATNFVDGKHEYLPIPYKEIASNPNIDPGKQW